jgi:hypothetical protein
LFLFVSFFLRHINICLSASVMVSDERRGILI